MVNTEYFIITIKNDQIFLTLTDTNALSQSGPENNGSEGVVHVLQSLRMEPHHHMHYNP